MRDQKGIYQRHGEEKERRIVMREWRERVVNCLAINWVNDTSHGWMALYGDEKNGNGDL